MKMWWFCSECGVVVVSMLWWCGVALTCGILVVQSKCPQMVFWWCEIVGVVRAILKYLKL